MNFLQIDYWTTLWINSIFEKKYPLLKCFITDLHQRDLMNHNNDLFTKYDNNSNLIEFFIGELQKHFSREEVISFIEILLKKPENIMKSIMVSYLNSEDDIKKRNDFIKLYEDISDLGIDCVKYIETYGMVGEGLYENIPEQIAAMRNTIEESKYKEDNEKLIIEFEKIDQNFYFRDEAIKDIYPSLGIKAKKLLNNLIKGQCFYKVFGSSAFGLENITASFSSIINGLAFCHVDENILNSRVFFEIGDSETFALINQIMLSDGEVYIIRKIAKNVKILINNGRYKLLKNLILADKINILDNYDEKSVLELSDDFMNNKNNPLLSRKEIN